MKAHCKVCGVSYDVCYNCQKAKSWRMHTDTIEHYYILRALMDYKRDGDAVKAADTLAAHGIDIRKRSDYIQSVRELMREIDRKAILARAAAKAATPTPESESTGEAIESGTTSTEETAP